MRRFKWILILSILMIFSTITVFADNGDIIQVGMNGQNVDVRQVDVLMDGQALESKVPSFIYIDRTLVPLRFVAESYGAEVSWEQSTKTATVVHKDSTVKLTIDSPIASLNEDVKVLDKNSIPRLVTFSGDDARTMVPLAFISEILGYEVGYDEDSRVPYINTKPVVEDEKEEPIEKPEDGLDSLTTITDIYIDKGSTEKHKVVIKSDNKIQYTSKVLPETNKLVIDIENAILRIKDQWDKPGKVSILDDNFTRLEYSQYSLEPDIVRVVITMTDLLDYDIVSSKDEKTNIVSFVNKIDDIRLETVEGKDLILIEGNKEIEYKVMRLQNPGRIVIDILDASLSNGTYHEFPFEVGFIKGVRVSQFQADNNYSSLDRIVRVVLDINDLVVDPLLKIDNVDINLVIYPEKNLWEDISYELDGKDRILNISNEKYTLYSVENYPETKTLEIIVPSDLTDLEEGHVYVKDGLIEEIEVIKDNLNTVIQVKYNKSILFEVLSNARDKNIIVKINRNLDVKPSERIIVIDAGHGGDDPGAPSVTGKREKDLNFSVANKLRQELIEKGYNVIMTRDTDTNVDLYERARIANDNNADIFISIHGNSFVGNRNINGIEVYYWPANKSDIKIEDQYPFAKSIHDELIKATGAASRGVKTNSYVVIRETKMSAVLIETGFLSNPEEEKLLYSDEYQNNITEGIIKGVESYFEMY
ncbi:MAG: N-acetylmuramoyl-L-alanine amidase family protein [Tissierellaceae bacterium]|nr:N-acetylmuramoyl-L-alanine amidase family protein [Tissierellaceae bacterium]